MFGLYLWAEEHCLVDRAVICVWTFANGQSGNVCSSIDLCTESLKSEKIDDFINDIVSVLKCGD